MMSAVETQKTNKVGKVELSILIVSYNTAALTLAAIASVKAETSHTSYEIIVVDNASPDGSAAAIASAHPDVRLIALSRNIGFAAANNLASAEARGGLILLLNPDTVVLDRAIDRLVDFARREPLARIWGGRTLFAAGSLNPTSCCRRMSLWNLFSRASGLTGLFPRSELFNSEAFGGWPRDRVRQVDIVSGCFLMIRASLWRKLGGFAPVFFMYGEEADLCLRAKRLGARPMVTPDATIIHLGGASETVRSAKLVKLLAAKATLIERHFGPFTRDLGLLMLMAWPLSRWLALSAVAAVTGKSGHQEAARTWGEVWAQRRAWSEGYPLREASPATPAGALARPAGHPVI